MRRATQNDVAREAGVTRAAVSCVLNNRTSGSIRISEETRKKILEASRKLGYRVNLAARSLQTKRTENIAMLVPDLGNPFYPMQIRGAQIAAKEDGYRLIIFDSSSSAQGEREFLDMALGHVADGLILSAFHLDKPEIKTLLRNGIPCVGLIAGLMGTGIDMVTTDQGSSVTMLMEYLFSKGHRKIAHLMGNLETANGMARRDAYRRSLASHGLEARPRWELKGNFRREGISPLLTGWFGSFSAKDRPTALFAANDLMAVEAIKVLKRDGISIPSDIAVCGIDNIPEAQYVDPSLTSVGQDNEAIGRLATRLLIKRIGSGDLGNPVTEILPSQLFIRESA
jgi:LacI family transcriptional regulator